MKKNILGVLLITLNLISCDYETIADFEIKNNTGFKIDSLKIEPNINKTQQYISLHKGDKIKYKCNMTSIPKVDGAYKISFLINGKYKSEIFGYYTNGSPLEKITKIKIERDTIIINQIFEKY